MLTLTRVDPSEKLFVNGNIFSVSADGAPRLHTMLEENIISEPRSSDEIGGSRSRGRRRDVRECFSAEWAALRRKGSHQELELEWSVLSWDRETPGKTEISSSSS